MTVSQVLRSAADRIERDGWCQGAPDRGPCRCAARAIVEAGGTQGIGVGDALMAVRAHVNGDSVIQWNDAPGRTVDEVIAALRGAAASVEGNRE